MHYVYVIYNCSAKRFYIGQTRDLDQRVIEHNTKFFGKSYTSRFAGSWELIYKEEYGDKSSALRREKQLKSSRGRNFIKTKLLPV